MVYNPESSQTKLTELKNPTTTLALNNLGVVILSSPIDSQGSNGINTELLQSKLFYVYQHLKAIIGVIIPTLP